MYANFFKYFFRNIINWERKGNVLVHSVHKQTQNNHTDIYIIVYFRARDKHINTFSSVIS